MPFRDDVAFKKAVKHALQISLVVLNAIIIIYNKAHHAVYNLHAHPVQINKETAIAVSQDTV